MTEIIVAVISAIGAIGASITGVLAAKSRKEQAAFRDENASQHGATLALIQSIEHTTWDIRQDVRDVRGQLESHIALGDAAHAAPRQTRKEPADGTVKKADSAKPKRAARRAS
jgi:hypothetical protein